MSMTSQPGSPWIEGPHVKTKIVATIGPACASREGLEELFLAGVDLFRLNFAHGNYEWFTQMIRWIREISAQHRRPIGLLGDLSGPKIRLGELPEAGLRCRFGTFVEFVREGMSERVEQLTCTYERLIDDLRAGDRVLLADGTVVLRVVQSDPAAGRVTCEVVQPGLVRSRQGVNLPGVALSTPAVTEKDRMDLAFALSQEVDYIGLSFVRRAQDVLDLRKIMVDLAPKVMPAIVAKIEKTEAIADLEAIVSAADALMVARGDLGVEADIARVPVLQKQIIKLCNEHRVPVITATQMLDSMQKSELPTRAEASDVANAVLDGTDAVMLSGETAVGDHPVKAVRMMSRICRDAERLVEPRPFRDTRSTPRTRASAITEAVTHGAGTAAEQLEANLLAVATRGGKTAMALSKQRLSVPILALTDRPDVSRKMCLYWGIMPIETPAVSLVPHDLLVYVEELGRSLHLLQTGSKLVIVGSSVWSLEWHDLMLVHVVS